MPRRREIEIDPARGEIRIYDKRRRLWVEYAVMQLMSLTSFIGHLFNLIHEGWLALLPPYERLLHSRALHGHAQCLRRDGIMAWIASVPENAWMADAMDFELGDIEDYGLPIIQSGDDSLPLSMDDLLWLIGRHAQADGVPDGYRPKHLALIGLSPRA